MKLFRSALPERLEQAAPGREVRIFQSEAAEILESAESNRAYRTVFVLTLLFVSLVLIAFCVRVDRVIKSASGEIVTIEPTVVLGAFNQSIIKTIDVQEGDRVKKGQLLASLDPTFTTADVSSLKSQIAGYTAEIARCEAELTQQQFDMPPSTDAVANTFIAAQRRYFMQRKAQFDAQVRSYDDQIAQYQSTLAKIQNDEARYGDRARISQEIEQMRATLAAAQIGSKLNLLAATDQKLEIQRALDFDRNSAIEDQHQIGAATSTRDAYIQQWNAQVSQELVSAKASRDTAVEQLNKATKLQDLVRIEAPEDGMVLRIAKLSSGSVLNGNNPLFYLAPLRSPLEAEVHVLARDIGFIRGGDRTTIKLDAYNFVDHGTVEGKIRAISEGAFTEDDNTAAAAKEPYYKVFVTLDPITLRDVPPDFRLLPGITLTADIHIGTRSLFDYLFSGGVRGYGGPMREAD
jgi:hemolysin D